MMSNIPPKDWEALSAYLDGQLSTRANRRLERRLEESKELQSALEELLQTQRVLRKTPKVGVPRSFVLTPEMAGVQRGQPRAYPAFRLAFALASFLFIMVFAGDLMSTRLLRQSLDNVNSDAAVVQERMGKSVTDVESEAAAPVAPVVEAPAAELMIEPTPMMFEEAESAIAVEEPQVEATAVEEAGEVMLDQVEPPTDDGEPAGEPRASTSTTTTMLLEVGDSAMKATITETLQVTETEKMMEAPAEGMVSTVTPILTIQLAAEDDETTSAETPASAEEEVVPEELIPEVVSAPTLQTDIKVDKPESDEAESFEEAPSETIQRVPWRALEILLGLVMLITGIGMILLRHTIR